MNIDGYIPLSAPNLKGNELRYVTDAVAGGWVAGGSYIQRFEESFAAYAGTDGAVACQSGTAALHLALLDAGVGAGDLVVVPTLTFIAAVNPVRYVGAEPVFMDCDDSLCMDAGKFERYLRDECARRDDGLPYDNSLGRPVKAVVVVHVFGNMAEIGKITAVARAYGLTVIEDATEAIGTFFTGGPLKGRMAGTVGDYGAYSFNGNKIITTGGGGMVTARREGGLRHMRHLATQAKTDETYYTHDEVGYNYRMSNMQAAVGLAQLEQLEDFIGVKHTNYELYRLNGVRLLPFRGGIRSNYWFYSHPCGSADERDALISHLDRRGVQSRPIWGLCHEQPMYRENRAYDIAAACGYQARVVNVPCGAGLARDCVLRVTEEIKRFHDANNNT